MLQEVGRRLAALARPGEVVARLGGDEFALILGPVDGVEGCVRAAQAVIARAARAGGGQRRRAGYRRQRRDRAAFRITAVASTRCCATPTSHSTRPRTSRRDWVVYHARLRRAQPERLALLAELRRGIDRGELLLHFQPQIELATGTLRGVEALVRWRHPERGLLAPQEFIALAEHTGLIRPLTLWVVQAALNQADDWRAAGLDLPVAVNLSVRSITQELPADLSRILHRREREASLELEITETRRHGGRRRGAGRAGAS